MAVTTREVAGGMSVWPQWLAWRAGSMSLDALNDTFDDQRPIRVAIANDYPLVIAGLARALETYARWVAVVEYDSQTRVQRDVDVVLFDAFG